jgi:hypothetical protein
LPTVPPQEPSTNKGNYEENSTCGDLQHRTVALYEAGCQYHLAL